MVKQPRRARALLKRSSRFPMLARTLARVESLMRDFDDIPVFLENEDPEEEDDEQIALDDAYTMYDSERRLKHLTCPDMTRSEHALVCFQAKQHIAVDVIVEWSQQQYSINVSIVRESASTVQFSTFTDSSSEAAGDVFRALLVFNQLPDSPVGSSLDSIKSIIWNAGYDPEERLEILKSVAYVQEDVRSDSGHNSDFDDDPRWYSSSDSD